MLTLIHRQRGTQSGSVQYGTGLVEIDSWTPNVDNVILNCVTELTTTDMPAINHRFIRTADHSNSPWFTYSCGGQIGGNNWSLDNRRSGNNRTSNAHGFINHDTDFVDIYFYTKTGDYRRNRPALVKDWYDIAPWIDTSASLTIIVPFWRIQRVEIQRWLPYTYPAWCWNSGLFC